MGYQALLFCPDEKTARTVTQVLSELEFHVEACTEPFAAVKKLMGEHFDAVVVDCDNEQNATLLFKSARNSTSNQTSLAVAVVEGQAGVAKAFRIGANLVLTKPINIEQAKGTLRVARGLLRKSDPAKPAVPVATSAPTTATTTTPAPAPVKPAPKPAPVAKPVVAVTSPPVAKPVSKDIPVAKPPATPAWPAAAAASTPTPVAKASDVSEKSADQPAPLSFAASAPIEAAISKPVASIPKFEKAPEPPAAIKPLSVSSPSTSGTASAAAPARVPQQPKIVEPPAEQPVAAVLDKPAEAAATASNGVVGAAPTFTFGGANVEPKSEGGNKKVFLGVAAALVLAAAGYFGWSQFKGHASESATATAPATQSATVTQSPAKPVAQPVVPPVTSTPAATSVTANSSSPASSDSEESVSVTKENASHSATAAAKPSNSSSSSPAKPAVADKPEEKPEATPLLVKAGKAPAAQPNSAAAGDAPAPSMIGMATPESAPPPDLVPSSSSGFKPVLQTLSVSQGVSQGLLFKKVAPVYPSSALRMHIEGIVQLMATISKSGDITHVKVLSGDQQLSKAAADAVKQWKYKPYLLNGEPVEIQTQVTVNFKLPQ